MSYLQKKGFSLGEILLIFAVIFLVFGGTYFYFQRKFSKTSLEVEEPATEVGQNRLESAPKETKACDNFDCLIEAASSCQPMSVVLSNLKSTVFFNTFFQFPNYYILGQRKYEIKESQEENKCMLIITDLKRTFNMSEEKRQGFLAEGKTEKEIDEELKFLTKNLNLSGEKETICVDKPEILVKFLKAEKKYNELYHSVTTSKEFEVIKEKPELKKEMGLYDIEKFKAHGSYETSIDEEITYSFYSGEKLFCKIITPRQPANTSQTITTDECNMKGGKPIPVNPEGKGCPRGVIDLGTIIDFDFLFNEKKPQCCVAAE